RPGYDRIRLESLAFGMALGLRVGEICSLPINVLEKDKDTQRYFARVATEKSALSGAMAVTEIWEESLLEANAYLLEQCADARNRAREIEESGFNFVCERLLENRRIMPLTDGELAQLKVLGLDPDKYFFIGEIVFAFSLSRKEFRCDGKYGAFRKEVPRLVAAKMASWLDERFAKWDW